MADGSRAPLAYSFRVRALVPPPTLDLFPVPLAFNQQRTIRLPPHVFADLE